jgi:hypothetical protein
MKLRLRDSVGVLFIIGGGLLILQNLNIFSGDVENIIWTIVFGALGGFFLSRYFSRRQNWGWLIPGVSLLSIAISNLVELIPGAGDLYSDFIMLGGIGLSFVLVYLNDRINWWALIPGGLLISLGVGELVGKINPAWVDSGSILFLGLGITFMVLYVLPTPYGRLKWALIPSIILLGLGGFAALSENLDIGGLIGPAIIIIIGVLVLVNAIKK